MPLSIKSRLLKLSCNEKVFKESIPAFQEAFYKSEYKHKRNYQKAFNKRKAAKNIKKNIIWLKAPYSKNLATKVGNHSLKLIH